MATSAIAVERKAGSASRLLPLSGVAFVVLVLVSFGALNGDTPGASASAATINSFYDAHYGTELASSLVVAVAAPLLTLFGIVLATALWPRELARRPLWQSALSAGSAVAGATWLVAAFVHFSITDASHKDAMPTAALQTLNVLDANSFMVFNCGLGFLMLAAAGALLSRKIHPVLAWIALVAGITLFFPYADFFGLIVSGLWILTTSVQLFRRGDAFAA
jgi:hypothetical protein